MHRRGLGGARKPADTGTGIGGARSDAETAPSLVSLETRRPLVQAKQIDGENEPKGGNTQLLGVSGLSHFDSPMTFASPN